MDVKNSIIGLIFFLGSSYLCAMDSQIVKILFLDQDGVKVEYTPASVVFEGQTLPIIGFCSSYQCSEKELNEIVQMIKHLDVGPSSQSTLTSRKRATTEELTNNDHKKSKSN